MSQIELCSLCGSELYRVVAEGPNGYTAYSQTTGEEVPIPADVLKAYNKGNRQVPVSYACERSFPLSYRCTIQANGNRSSRVGDNHIAENI